MFNWRFIYHLEFLDAEEKLVHRTKESFFSLVEHEEKIPPKITLQVWDADTFSADDYLGRIRGYYRGRLLGLLYCTVKSDV